MTEPAAELREDEVQSLNIDDLDVEELERRVAQTAAQSRGQTSADDCFKYICYQVEDKPSI